jgi:50S ribosomal protein L16 3-hydroxylase
MAHKKSPPPVYDGIDLDASTPWLAGLTPKAFMRRHWQRQPLLIRQAWPQAQPPLDRAALFALAGQEGVESRLVVRTAPTVANQGATGTKATQARASAMRKERLAAPAWQVRQGPLPRTALPPVSRPGWTLLVQGVDLFVPAARALLDRFRFVPDARLDDVMVSWASPGGGVGPHVDSYDVFLLQVQGRRRWRVAPPGDGGFVPGLPLKILNHFEPQHDWVLEPGDMLYLPPGWGHEGEAVGGDCMTCSVGFRAPSDTELVRELLQRVLDAHEDRDAEPEPDQEPGHEREPVTARTAPVAKLYSDPKQGATDTPGLVPAALTKFAVKAVLQSLTEPQTLARALGELLSEPKPQVWFDAPTQALSAKQRAAQLDRGVFLDARTRLLYDQDNLFLNGESFSVSGHDGSLLRRLADTRSLSGTEVQGLSAQARAELAQWWGAGWIRSLER